MYDIEGKKISEILNRQAEGDKNVQRTNISEVSSNQSPLVKTPINHEITEPNAQFLIIPMGVLVIAWLMSFLSRFDFNKTVGKNLDTIKNCYQIPCSNCRFFKNDPYLKCAVHPSRAASAEAINCHDFWSLDSNKFHQ